MDWLILALIAPIVYTIVNFTDKFVVGKAIPDANSIPIFLAIVHATIALIIWIIAGFPILDAKLTSLLMVSGALIIVGTFMLFRALITEETSKIVMWTQLLPVVTLILAVTLLDEQLTALHYIGFFIIFASTLGLSFDSASLRITPAFVYILIAIVFWAVSDIILKYAFNLYPDVLGNPASAFDLWAFLNVIIYQSAGFAIAGLLIYIFIPNIRKSFAQHIGNAPPYALAILFANESLFILRQFIRSLAIALGSVALVSVLGGTRIFLGIILGWGLTRLAPEIFAENITRQELQRKFLFSIILFIGIIMLSVSRL